MRTLHFDEVTGTFYEVSDLNYVKTWTIIDTYFPFLKFNTFAEHVVLSGELRGE